MTLLTLSAIWEIFITLSCPTKSLTTYILCEIKVGANEKFSNLLGFRKKENTVRKDFVSIYPSHSLTSAPSPLPYVNLCVPVSSVHFSPIYYYFYCYLNLVVPIDYCYLVRRRFNRKHSSCPAPWFGGVT